MAKRANLEAQQLARDILLQPAAIERMKREFVLGILSPQEVTMLFHYAFGKPVETIDLRVSESLATLDDNELEAMERALEQQIASVH
jgi:hypothetical protein